MAVALPLRQAYICFTIAVLRNYRWTKVCFEHTLDTKYTFFAYNDADQWARKWLTEDYEYAIQQEILRYDPEEGRYK